MNLHGCTALRPGQPVVYPLTFGQEQLVIAEDMAPPGALAFPLRLPLHEEISAATVADVLRWVVRRHDALRMFTVNAGEPVQAVATARAVEQLPAGADLQAYGAGLHSAQAATGPLYYQLSEAHSDRQLTVHLHHVFTDAWSASLLARDFLDGCAALSHGGRLRREGLTESFAVYARALRRSITPEKIEQHMSFWTGELRSAEPLKLPYTCREWRPGARLGRLPAVVFEVSGCSPACLAGEARRSRGSAAAAMLAAVATVLRSATGQSDILLHTATADRGSAGKRALVGCLANRCVLRLRLPQDRGPGAALMVAQRALARALRYQHGPFQRDGRHGPAGQVLNLSPRVSVAFNHSLTSKVPLGYVRQRPPGRQPRRAGSHLAWDATAPSLTDMHIEMLIGLPHMPLRFSVAYRPDLWAPGTVEQLGQAVADWLSRLAGQAPAGPAPRALAGGLR